MASAHAEVGTIQQAFDDGLTKGRDMNMRVFREPVCGYCRGDIAWLNVDGAYFTSNINHP